MTIQNLKYMLEIADSRSLSKAARKLFVSQSTLSAALKEMEEDLGVALFQRTNRGVALTYDGEDFIRYAREIVEQTQYLEQRYHARKSLPMRFAVSTQHLPFAVRAFIRVFQQTDRDTYDMAIRECDTNSVIHDVAGNKSELGILAVPESHIRTMERLLSSYEIAFEEIDRIQNYVFFRKSHPLAEKEEISLKDLEKYPFVTYDQEIETSHFSEEPLFYKVLSKNLHVSDRCTKIALVRNTDCFSIGPDLTNSNADAFHKGMGEVVARPLKAEIGQLHLGYLFRRGNEITSLGRMFLEYLAEDVGMLARPAPSAEIKSVKS